MDGVMSQEEINALLNGSEDSSEQPKEEVLTEKEKIQSERLPISVWERQRPRCFLW